MIRRSLMIVTFLFILMAPLDLVAAQEETELDWKSSADYQFGQIMTFVLTGEPIEEINKVSLFISAPELASILMTEVRPEVDETFRASYGMDLTQIRLAPFTSVTYWWTIETNNGKLIRIPDESIDYVDDSLVWETAKKENVVVNWTGDDPDIGQTALSTASDAFAKLTSNIPIRSDNLVRIYVYPRSDDLQAALRLTGRNWVGAHAHPELGVVLVTESDATTSEQEFTNDISHELTHLLLFQVIGSNYQAVPLWLEEGLATVAEPENSGRYDETLRRALESETTIPFLELCHSFPASNGENFLAYAQSASMVRYIQNEFGDHAPIQLLGAIADGATCENVTDSVLGISMSDLNEKWLEQTAPDSIITRIWRKGGLFLVAIVAGFVLMSLIFIGHPTRR